MDEKTSKHIQLIKDHLCNDLNDESCKKLIELLKKNNKEDRIYFDTVRRTISLCRENDCPEDLPEDINERLFNALGIDKEKCKDKK